MVFNPDKCSFMLFGVKDELQDLVSDKVTIKNSKGEKVLGITFDNKLDVSPHLTSITKKANIKLNVLTRVQKYTTTEQKTSLTSSFIKSEFNCCSLKKALQRLNRLNDIHERSLSSTHSYNRKI